MAKFRHLTETKRYQLETLLKAKVPKKEIARILGVHLNTVYNEIKRGRYEYRNGATWEMLTGYSPQKAHDKYRQHLKDKGAPIKLGKDYELAEYIERRIIEGKLSPGAVLGEIKRKGLQFQTFISINTLYKYIEQGVFARLTVKHLPGGGKKKKARRRFCIKKAPAGTSIEYRPIEILERNSFGHWEMDCVCGPTKNSLLVLTERLTRKEIIFPIPSQKAENVVRCLNRLERQFGSSFKLIFKSITVDNGSEFSDFPGMEKSIFGGGKSVRTKVYYCHPYSSYERGSNERINREIRRLIPKGTDLSIFSPGEIQDVEDWVNNYPRRIFDYQTSQELYNYHLSMIA